MAIAERRGACAGASRTRALSFVYDVLPEGGHGGGETGGGQDQTRRYDQERAPQGSGSMLGGKRVADPGKQRAEAAQDRHPEQQDRQALGTGGLSHLFFVSAGRETKSRDQAFRFEIHIRLASKVATGESIDKLSAEPVLGWR